MPMSPRLLRPFASGFPLDGSSPTAVYSLRRLRASYAGPAVRIRRSSDNAELDFTPGQIQGGVLADWIGSGNNGFVTTWYDQSGNGLNVSQSVAANQPQISLTTGRFGTASVLFDGTNDRLNAGGQSDFAFGTGDFTVELWIRMTSIQTVEQIFDFRDTVDPLLPKPQINLALDGGASNSQAVWYINNVARIRGTTQLATATWYHIAVSRSGTSTRLFVNGTQEGSTWTDSTNYTVGASRPAFGTNGSDFNPAQFFSGHMDEIRMTKGRANYTANFTPPVR